MLARGSDASPPPAALPRLTTTGRLPSLRLLAFALPLALVALLGVIHLPQPFHPDKALFQLGARTLAEGGTLYVDFWDLKKPGIYVFHAAAGMLFGFTEVGVHLFELLYLLVLSVCIAALAWSWLERRRLAALAPVATIGLYYCVVDLWHLTQPAILASFPIFIAMWLASATYESAARRRAAFAASGVAAGGALAFKLALAPIPLAFWVVATVAAVRSGERPAPAARDRVLMGLLGTAAVVAVVALSFWRRGALDALVESTVAFPAGEWWALGRVLRWRIGSSLIWFVASVLPFLALASLAFTGWRGPRRDLPTLQLATWMAVGTLAILLEHYAWWPFDFLVLVVPVGLLALRGIDGAMRVLARQGERARWAPRLARGFPSLAVIALAPGLVRWQGKARPVVEAARSGNADWVHAYQVSMEPSYEHVATRMDFLREPGALPGPIYVLGNPLYQLRSGRPQAIPVNGWAWETLADDRVGRVAQQLQRAAPAYIFVSRSMRDNALLHRVPSFVAWIARDYEIVLSDAEGSWHRRRRDAAPY